MRPAPARTPRPAAALLAVLALLLLAGGVAPSPAAAAAVRDVRLTQDGPVPRQLTLAAGDSVRFVNADAFVHRAVSDGDGWAFDTGTLAPGQTFTVQPALTRPGTYAYRGAGLDDFRGTVVVPGATATRSPSAAPRPSSAAPAVPVPAASPSPSAAPPPAGSPSPAAAPAAPSATPAPVATGGTGTALGPPPLAGSSFGGFDGLAPTPSPGAPAPLLAPEVPLGVVPPLAVATPDPLLPAADAQAAPQALDLPRLSSPVEARRFGLPLVLAAVALAGVVSVLVRLLLTEAPPSEGGPAPA